MEEKNQRMPFVMGWGLSMYIRNCYKESIEEGEMIENWNEVVKNDIT